MKWITFDCVRSEKYESRKKTVTVESLPAIESPGKSIVDLRTSASSPEAQVVI